ncbi:hypothetical protein [Actinoplanes sp. URMC 104]|uniref:hypothetical protein n=1 Tax=Actinoplanes sp. URMC 104 TaxID=3423409 RepID=UPI003F1A26AE
MHHLALRQGLAACAALAALAVTTACSDDSSGATDATAATPAAAATAVPPAPVDPAVAASADAALAGDTRQICAQAERAGAGFGELFVAGRKLRAEAAGKGAAARQQAAEKTSRDVQNYSYALADMAGLTTDPALKKALTEMSAQVKALKGDVSKINDAKISAWAARLGKACGKG